MMRRRTHSADGPRSTQVHVAEHRGQRAPRWRLIVMGLIPTVAVIVVYARAFDAPFVFDDHSSVVNNPSITQLWPLLGDVNHPGPLKPVPQSCTAGRPVVNLSLALNYRWGGLNPRGYHLVNVALHAASSYLVWIIVTHTLCLPGFSGRFGTVASLLAMCVALLWALHPLQTEAVEYITQRSELLVGFFYLGTLYASICYWSSVTMRARAAWLVVASCSCLAGMASKEVMVSAPIVILLYERTFVASSFRRVPRDSWPLYAGLAAGWILLFALNSGGPRSQSAGFHLGLPLWPWWFTQAKVLVMYLRLAIWPWPLAIHYDFPLADSLSTAWPYLIITGALMVASIFLVARRAASGFLLATVLLILAPTLIVPIKTEVAAERRMYLPLAALSSLAVVGGFSLASRLFRHPAWRRGGATDLRPLALTIVCSLSLAVTYAALSARRLAVYNDVLTFWLDAVAQQPQSHTNQSNAGIALQLAGRLPESIEHFAEAARLNSGSSDKHNNLGFALIAAGRASEALPHLERARELSPEAAEVHNNLGLALNQLGRTAEAIREFEEALRLNPDFPEAQLNLGVLLESAGRAPEAVEHLSAALRLRPGMIDALWPLARAFQKLGRIDEAKSTARRAQQSALERGDRLGAKQIQEWIDGLAASVKD